MEVKSNETKIGGIPDNWEVVRLGDVSLGFVSGGTPSTKNPAYWNGDIPWMTSAHINGRTVTQGVKCITEEGLKNSATNVVPKNNILIATRVGIGKVAINLVDMTISQDLTGVVLDHKKVNVDFVYWLLSTYTTKLKSLAQGSTIKGLLRKEIENLKLPLPPLPEQHRIAEILTTADTAIRKVDDAMAKTERLKRGLMQELLTKGIGHEEFKDSEVGRIPMGWEVDTLPNLMNIIDYRGRTPPFSNSGIPYIGSDNIRNERIIFNNKRYVSEETYSRYMTRGIPNPGDILFTTEAPLCETAIIPDNFKFCFAQRLVALQCKTNCNSTFFMYILRSRIVQKQLRDWSTGTTVKGISAKNMKFIKIPYSNDIEEQCKIAEILSTVDKNLELERKRKEKLDRVKKGLMNVLLTGRRRVKVS